MLRSTGGRDRFSRKTLGLPERTTFRTHHVHGRSRAHARTAIVIPARNEEHRIERCLQALAGQRHVSPSQFVIIVVANNCVDATIDRALALARDASLSLTIIDFTLADGGSAGLARRVGCSAALTMRPEIDFILTTDADCVVDERWLCNSLKRLRSADTVCGEIVPDPSEYIHLPQHVHRHDDVENAYVRTTLEFLSLVLPDPLNPWPNHGQAAGASLGFRRAAYRLAGGFADIECGEDREIIRTCKTAGLRVIHASDVRVTASCRLVGRAKGGMADTLSARSADPVGLVDRMLSPARLTISRTLGAASKAGARTIQLPTARHPLRLADLPKENARLSDANRLLREAPMEDRLLRLGDLAKRV